MTIKAMPTCWISINLTIPAYPSILTAATDGVIHGGVIRILIMQADGIIPGIGDGTTRGFTAVGTARGIIRDGTVRGITEVGTARGITAAGTAVIIPDIGAAGTAEEVITEAKAITATVAEVIS